MCLEGRAWRDTPQRSFWALFESLCGRENDGNGAGGGGGGEGVGRFTDMAVGMCFIN